MFSRNGPLAKCSIVQESIFQFGVRGHFFKGVDIRWEIIRTIGIDKQKANWRNEEKVFEVKPRVSPEFRRITLTGLITAFQLFLFFLDLKNIM